MQGYKSLLAFDNRTCRNWVFKTPKTIQTDGTDDRKTLEKVLPKLRRDDDLICTSVDDNQGDQKPFVILDLVTLGGTNSDRDIVALSRAENYFAIIGSAGMTHNHDSTKIRLKRGSRCCKFWNTWKQYSRLRFEQMKEG